MSGIAVVFHRDGAPVTRDQLVRMTDRIAHRGPDGIGHWENGPAGLAHCALHTLPEDVGQKQPIHSADSQLHLTFDGRIDNRDDLRKTLALPARIPDAEIVLAAYAKWGESCPERLLGDFAFAIWDERLQQLFCARDIMGVKPFLYFFNDRVFLAGSERRQLFTHPAPTRAPNEQVIAALMMMRCVSQSTTIHKDIQRLPPATSMTVSREAVRFRRYWNINDIASLPRHSDDAFAQQFWELLTDATRCRMRSVGKVGVLLSGGLDSTTIAAVMTELRQSKPQRAPRIASYSLGFPGWDEADETDLIRETTAALDLDGRILPPHQRPRGGYEADVRQYIDMPDYFNDAFWDDARQEAVDSGNQVLLTGLGGDEWFAGSIFAISDYIRRGQIRTAWQEARAIASRRGLTPAAAFWRFGVRTLAPEIVVRIQRARREPSSGYSRWVHPDFARRTGLARLIWAPPVSSRRTKSHHMPLMVYESGTIAHMLEMHDRANARFRLETRHPFHDRRLIEFGLGLPVEQCRKGGVTKAVIRNATRHRIPESIRTRNSKADFSRHMTEELRHLAGSDFFRNSELARREWIVPEPVHQMLQEALAHPPQPNYRIEVRLWNLYALELMAYSGVI